MFSCGTFCADTKFLRRFFSVNFPTMDLDRRGLVEIPSGKSIERWFDDTSRENCYVMRK